MRLIIIKDDGSFLIHRSTGVKPVNYMTDVTSVTETDDEPGQSIISVESKKGETIDVIVFNKLLDLTIPMEKDTADTMVNGTERQLQEWLSRPEIWNETIGEDTVFIGRELATSNGKIDLAGYDLRTDRMIIVEVKRKAKKNDVYQVLRYREAVLTDISKNGSGSKIFNDLRVMMEDADPTAITMKSLSDPECWLIGESAHDGTLEFCEEHGVKYKTVGSRWWGQTVDNAVASKTA